ncbi:MAG: hypothetical protein FWJ72_06505, partial [Acidimicrobiia bacterium]
MAVLVGAAELVGALDRLTEDHAVARGRRDDRQQQGSARVVEPAKRRRVLSGHAARPSSGAPM